MFKSVNNVIKNETPNITVKRLGNIPFRGKSDYERQPDVDSYESENKPILKTGGIITTTLLAAGLTFGIFCYAKGGVKGSKKNFGQRMKDGWKKIFGKGHKKVKLDKSLEFAKLTNDAKDTKKIAEELELYEIFADIPGECGIGGKKIVQRTAEGKVIR